MVRLLCRLVSVGAVVVFDLGDPDTFETAKTWVKEVKEFAGEQVRIVIAANKADLPTHAVDDGTARRFAKSVKGELFYTSAKTGEGVDGMFSWLAKGYTRVHIL